jgi:type II secretory pathway pseudopilin PulG
MSASPLMPAPGAKAAKVCGILAIVFALTCVGIPVAVVLGIVALVQHGKAKRLARAQPEAYEAVPSTGLVTGIIGLVLPVFMLPFAGIVSAIAIPALLSQRARAQEAALRVNFRTVQTKAEALVLDAQAKAPNQPQEAEALIRGLMADPELAALRNPCDPKAPALQAAPESGPGVICLFPGQEQAGGVTTFSVKLRAAYPGNGGEKALEAEVITRTQEHVQTTEEGWQVIQNPGETPAPPQ